jgi:hypothetical protein
MDIISHPPGIVSVQLGSSSVLRLSLMTAKPIRAVIVALSPQLIRLVSDEKVICEQSPVAIIARAQVQMIFL